MRRRIVLLAFALSLSGCGQPLLWRNDKATRDRLLKIVPVGSAISTLEAEAKSRGWRISSRDDRTLPKGEEHYFGNRCRHQGGMSENIVVAEHGLLTTTVESVWIFDRAGRLGDVCVRRSTDAL